MKQFQACSMLFSSGDKPSRTEGVLGAVPSAAVMGTRRIFSRGEGGGKFRDANK